MPKIVVLKRKTYVSYIPMCSQKSKVETAKLELNFLTNS